MAFSDEDKQAIKFLRETKGYTSRRFIKEFPEKGWSRSGLDKLLRKIDSIGSVQRLPGSGRPRSVRTVQNIEAVESLILSQEDLPQTHRSQRQIAREARIDRSSVRRIIKRDLRLKCFKKQKAHELTAENKQKRLDRSRQLLRRYPASLVNFIVFTDEKLFTVAAPSNSQNDRVYSSGQKRDISVDRLLRTRPTFTKSIMVSVGVSALGRTQMHFVEPGVKINGDYYRNTLLLQWLLPDIRELSEYFIFQQDSAPAHRARETVTLLETATPAFIAPNLWPPNSPDLNPVDYKIWSVMQEKVYRTKVRDVDDLRRRILDAWDELDQRVLDSAVKQWRVRLRACVEADGGQFEYKL
jgi:inhibitor of nuclear factor kappa-B kinase subunit alpha